MILASEDNQTVNYWYEGICPYSGDLFRLPRTLEIEAIARQLMQELEKDYEKTSVEPCSTEVFSGMEGKMYGVLLAESEIGEKLVLKAFSGLLNGKSHLDGWIPPIAGREKVAIAESITLNQLALIKQELIELSEIPERLEYEQKFQEYAFQLQVLRDRHQVFKQARQAKRSQLLAAFTGTELELALKELEGESQREKMARRNFKRDRDQVLLPLLEVIKAADCKMQILKTQRRELSRTLQTQMHRAYVLTNFAGETRSLRELITEGAMPTGMGDCCAPKLLDYAANHNLKPLAMAEFWWGKPSLDGYKIQGEFYGACVERCQPLMGFLLSGRRSPPAPLSFENVAKQHSQNLSVLENVASQHFQIIYDDKCILAIAKPAGLLSIPGRYLDTQDSALSRLQQTLGESSLLYPVHRLDRQTSGILLFAHDLETLRNLSAQFQQKEIHKIYEALLSGKLERKEGVIDLPLWGNPENRPRQQVDFQKGKPSVTKFRLIGYQQNYSRVEFTPLTGRTHQLRVHSVDPRGLGMPILGDRLYGCQVATDRLHLHAKELTFRHPRSQKLIHLRISVPF
ncbi:RluA family pseudouridine synthase [Pseudanabaena sp. FACHB-1998]|uniref:RluA family pseudouridine synthase n=1 Tax=Pseudanabaena sp. FACHB-1998 TaxID=2692858 RepID=UPI001680531B|nr:RluA family pseudouridine synthase [Pseudanabaena sp. FACHB-1998]MBD2175566.1 RluA family pseudouridine synthase [Pseudanabaena sp. FACHB-1998]